MSQASTDYRWGALRHSERGASHIHQDLPNQDALAHCLPDDGSPPVILAVADGHGSPKSFRSDVGARLAVETAVAVCREFLDGMQGAEPSAVKNDAERRIPPRIVQGWKRRVAEDFEQRPFTEEEMARLEQQAGPEASRRATLPERIPVAYGATLLIAVLAEEFLLCFQLGDGDILVAYDATAEVGQIATKDESLIANETTSLCQDDCLRYFRCQIQPIRKDCPPGLILLATDGYRNSFASPEAFRKTATDYLDLIRTEGAEAIAQDLPGWLKETSESGSGDDITVGIIYRRQPPLGTAERRETEIKVPAATPLAEATAGTEAASEPPGEAAEAVPPTPAGPTEEAGKHGTGRPWDGLLGPVKRLFGAHRENPEESQHE